MYVMSLVLLRPAKPRRPEPNSNNVPGSGTGDGSSGPTKLPITNPPPPVTLNLTEFGRFAFGRYVDVRNRSTDGGESKGPNRPRSNTASVGISKPPPKSKPGYMLAGVTDWSAKIVPADDDIGAAAGRDMVRSLKLAKVVQSTLVK